LVAKINAIAAELEPRPDATTAQPAEIPPPAQLSAYDALRAERAAYRERLKRMRQRERERGIQGRKK
jgi:hypothetical protein